MTHKELVIRCCLESEGGIIKTPLLPGWKPTIRIPIGQLDAMAAFLPSFWTFSVGWLLLQEFVLI